MKYYLGEVVAIRENLRSGMAYGDLLFVEDMKKFRGFQARIDGIRSEKDYLLSVDNHTYLWSEEMLMPVNRKQITSAKYQELTQIPLKSDKYKTQNPCKHCDPNLKLPTQAEPHEFFIFNRALYCCDSDFGWEGRDIKFCPWCGRSLVDDRDNSEDNLNSNELKSMPAGIEKLCKMVGALLYTGAEEFTIKYSGGKIACNIEALGDDKGY